LAATASAAVSIRASSTAAATAVTIAVYAATNAAAEVVIPARPNTTQTSFIGIDRPDCRFAAAAN
jgi:hypothetical protein